MPLYLAEYTFEDDRSRLRHPINQEDEFGAQIEMVALGVHLFGSRRLQARLIEASDIDWEAACKSVIATVACQSSRLTDLEAAVLGQMEDMHKTGGWPTIAEVRVTNRESTGGGRYTMFDHPAPAGLTGNLDAGIIIDLPFISSGLGGLLLVRDGRITALEFFVFGGDFWSGDEKGWSFRPA